MMTSELFKSLFQDFREAVGYDGSPEAKARRNAQRDSEQASLLAGHWASKTQSILDTHFPPENRGDDFSRFDTEGNPERESILGVSRDFAREPAGRVLTIIGGCGRGKTLLATSIARTWLDDHLHDFLVVDELEYVTEHSLLERYDRARSYKSLESTDDVIAKYSNCGLLVIDELGKWQDRRDGIAVLEELIDHRLGHRPTILLSNLTPDEFQARYTGGFLSRVVGNVYALAGRDHRLWSMGVPV